MTPLALPGGGLSSTASSLEQAATDLADRAARPPLPDAGRSTGELAAALAAFAVGGQHLAGRLEDLGTGLRRAEELLGRTDRMVGDGFDALGVCR